MNKLEDTRAYIAGYLNQTSLTPNKQETHVSPSGHYRMEVDCYNFMDEQRQVVLSVATVTDQRTGEVVATIRRDEDRFCHCWLEKEGIEYLICSEDFEGQTVVDLTHHHTESFASEEDPFIWVTFHPSPDKNKLAIIGCYWACPFMVIVYEFNDPMTLPLKMLHEVVLPGNDANFGEWMNNDTFSLVSKDGTIHIHTVEAH